MTITLTEHVYIIIKYEKIGNYTCNRKEFNTSKYCGSLECNVDINKDLELHVFIMERYLSNK